MNIERLKPRNFVQTLDFPDSTIFLQRSEVGVRSPQSIDKIKCFSFSNQTQLLKNRMDEA